MTVQTVNNSRESTDVAEARLPGREVKCGEERSVVYPSISGMNSKSTHL